MAEYINITPQTVATNSPIIFNQTTVPGCCKIQHRNGSGAVKLHGGTCCNPSRYRVSVHANVLGVVGAIQFGIFQDGELLPETLMAVVPGGATDVWSIDATTEVKVDCNCSQISVRNLTASTITVNTANIIIDKEV